MKDDPIVADVRKVRREILESYDWDFERMSRDVIKRQKESNRKIVSLGKKIPQQDVAPNAYPLRASAK